MLNKSFQHDMSKINNTQTRDYFFFNFLAKTFSWPAVIQSGGEQKQNTTKKLLFYFLEKVKASALIN